MAAFAIDGKQARRVRIPNVTHVASSTHTGRHYPESVEALALALIDDPSPYVNQL